MEMIKQMKRKHVLGMVLTAVMCASMSMGALAEEDFHLELNVCSLEIELHSPPECLQI